MSWPATWHDACLVLPLQSPQRLVLTVPAPAGSPVPCLDCSCLAGSPAPLLASINLQLPANKLGLIFGRSGAGKTTLLQLLAGLQPATHGSITLGAGIISPLGSCGTNSHSV